MSRCPACAAATTTDRTAKVQRAFLHQATWTEVLRWVPCVLTHCTRCEWTEARPSVALGSMT